MVAPLIIAGIIGAGASLASGFMGAQAAEKAAQTQADASDRALALQEKQYNQSRQDAMPWMEAGKTALHQYMGELGLGGSDFTSKFTETPGYAFKVQEGEKGVVNNLNALGMKNSGAALKALTRFRQGLAGQEYGSYLDRLAGASGMGQQQVGQMNALGAQSAANQSNTIMAGGEARASGYVGGANSWINALKNFSDNTGRALGRYDNSWAYVGA